MNKYLMFFDYIDTWKGIIRLGISVYGISWILRLLISDDNKVLGIVLSVVIAVITVYLVLLSIDNFKTAYRYWSSDLYNVRHNHD